MEATGHATFHDDISMISSRRHHRVSPPMALVVGLADISVDLVNSNWSMVKWSTWGPHVRGGATVKWAHMSVT